MTNEALVTVATFADLAAAELAASLLEAEGISASIPNSQLVGIDWRLSNAVGGIQLQVEAAREPEARALLAQGVAPQVEEGVPESMPEPGCPSCRSVSSRPDPTPKRLVALSLLFPPLLVVSLPAYIFARGRLECLACGNRWTPSRIHGA